MSIAALVSEFPSLLWQERRVERLAQEADEAARVAEHLRRSALVAAQRKAAQAERDIEAMRNELETVKALLQQDPLTGTLNRRGIDEIVPRELSRAARANDAVAIMLIGLLGLISDMAFRLLRRWLCPWAA